MITPKYIILKRFIDVSVSLIILIILSPLLFIIALAVKCDSSGPLIFSQNRLGKNEKVFKMLKFRTMVENAGVQRDNKNHSAIVRDDDPRITCIGRILRKTSLDELPQLINVLRGEMSLIGPRPDLPTALNFYDANERDKLLVLPGMTGISQVSGRNELPPKERWKLDAEYARSLSFKQDITIFAKTLLVVVKQRGIYSGSKKQ